MNKTTSSQSSLLVPTQHLLFQIEETVQGNFYFLNQITYEKLCWTNKHFVRSQIIWQGNMATCEKLVNPLIRIMPLS